MKKAFTLIEVIMVVVIIGILSSLAMTTYNRYRLVAKTAEAKMNIGAIITCEDSYAAIEGKYLTEEYKPDDNPGPEPRSWNDTNAGNFKVIGYRPSGKVYYSYGVAAGDVSANPANATPSHGEVAATNGTDITVIAKGDLDGDNETGFFCTTDVRFPKIKGVIGDF